MANPFYPRESSGGTSRPASRVPGRQQQQLTACGEATRATLTQELLHSQGQTSGKPLPQVLSQQGPKGLVDQVETARAPPPLPAAPGTAPGPAPTPQRGTASECPSLAFIPKRPPCPLPAGSPLPPDPRDGWPCRGCQRKPDGHDPQDDAFLTDDARFRVKAPLGETGAPQPPLHSQDTHLAAPPHGQRDHRHTSTTT